MKHPERSEGARMERKAIRSYLRRRIQKLRSVHQIELLRTVIDWVLTREKRYDAKKGGL